MRVFLGPVEIAGVYRGLKEGFEALGHACDLFNLYANAWSYGGEVDDPLTRLARWGSVGSAPRRVIGRAARIARFVDVARAHDVFIYGFASSFTGVVRELALLKRLGKTVILQFHGSDSRPTYMDGAIVGPETPTAAVVARTRHQARRLALMGRYADAIVDIPPTGAFHRRPFINWLHVGLPSRPRAFAPAPVSARAPGDAVRVLHAPTNERAKGSARIRAMVSALRERGLAVELVEVKNRPNADVLREIARCDLVFDQLYADYGMATLAVEAAWLGKPALVGGYAAPEWRHWLPDDARPPSTYVLPEDAPAALERLVRDEGLRAELGARARRFVEEKWSPRAVAERYLRIARGEIPAEWLVDPTTIRYAHGLGLEDAEGRQLLSRVVAHGGRRALQVPHNPGLEAALLERAQAEGPR